MWNLVILSLRKGKSSRTQNEGRLLFVLDRSEESLWNTQVWPIGECIIQHWPLICDFNIRNVKDTKRKFTCKSNIWKLYEGSIRSDLSFYIKEFKENVKADATVEGKGSSERSLIAMINVDGYSFLAFLDLTCYLEIQI